MKNEIKIETLKQFIEHCFYNYEGKLKFYFGEMWEPEDDKRISPKLLKKLKKMAGKL